MIAVTITPHGTAPRLAPRPSPPARARAMIHVPHAASWVEQINLPSRGCDFLSRGFGTLSQPGSSVLCRESDPLEESWFGPPLPSADPSFVPPFVQSSGVEKSNLEFLLPATEIRAAAAHQTKSAVVMLLILLCLVTRHSDGDGRCRCRRRKKAGRRRETRGAAAPAWSWGTGTGRQGEVAQSIREHLFWPV